MAQPLTLLTLGSPSCRGRTGAGGGGVSGKFGVDAIKSFLTRVATREMGCLRREGFPVLWRVKDQRVFASDG